MDQQVPVHPDNTRTGIALLCNEEGIVQQVMRDQIGIVGPTVGRPFTLLVDRGSMTKALTFLVKLRTEHAVFGWEINVPIMGQTVTLHFAGGRLADQLLIVGASNGGEMMTLFEELMRIGNQQANELRAALKDKAMLAGDRPRDAALYDEISRLNNQLVQMQRELARQNAELERLNSLKNHFLGMAAHDLRNPLGHIHGFVEYLRRDMGPNLSEEQQQIMTIILRSSQFMANLINDLLDVAKIESGYLMLELQPVDLVALVRQNVDLNRTLAAGKDIRLRLQVEPLPDVTVDPNKIDQVLNNLLSNAIKFSHLGDEVIVSLRRQDAFVLLQVQDWGLGISAERLGTLFHPFQGGAAGTAGEKSTGLGLVIVKRIVEGHGGTIRVESKENEGTTFFVRLPISPVTRGKAEEE